MLDLTIDAPAPTRPGRLPAAAPLSTLLARTLDEVDFGIALVAEDGEVLHLNLRARQALGGGGALQVLGKRLCTADPHAMARLHATLHDAAQRGLRRLLSLHEGAERQLVAVVPLQPGVAALLLGRPGVCEDLSLQCFAQGHDLTAAEARVLAGLGRGDKPGDIARAHGVKLSTVRTQIGALRQKTGAPTITDLVRLVAGLPPMVSALRA